MPVIYDIWRYDTFKAYRLLPTPPYHPKPTCVYEGSPFRMSLYIIMGHELSTLLSCYVALLHHKHYCVYVAMLHSRLLQPWMKHRNENQYDSQHLFPTRRPIHHSMRQHPRDMFSLLICGLRSMLIADLVSFNFHSRAVELFDLAP